MRRDLRRETVSRVYLLLVSFHESVSPPPQSISLGPFGIFSKIHGCQRYRRQICHRCQWFYFPKLSKQNNYNFYDWRFFYICHQCHRHRWCTLSCEYLREFSKNFERALMVPILRVLGETDSWKKQKSKISWHCPFNFFSKRKIRSSWSSPQEFCPPACVFCCGSGFLWPRRGWPQGGCKSAAWRPSAHLKKEQKFCFRNTDKERSALPSFAHDWNLWQRFKLFCS